MANINLSANNGLFTIALDRWEWTSLEVNGQTITANPDGDLQFLYSELTEDPVYFVAKGSQDIRIVNPDTMLKLEAPNGKDGTYCCSLSYTDNGAEGVSVQGLLVTVDAKLTGAQPSPIQYSQGKMTGQFQAT